MRKGVSVEKAVLSTYRLGWSVPQRSVIVTVSDSPGFIRKSRDHRRRGGRDEHAPLALTAPDHIAGSIWLSADSWRRMRRTFVCWPCHSDGR